MAPAEKPFDTIQEGLNRLRLPYIRRMVCRQSSAGTKTIYQSPNITAEFIPYFTVLEIVELLSQFIPAFAGRQFGSPIRAVSDGVLGDP